MEKQSVYPQSVSRWQLLPNPSLCCKPSSPVRPRGHFWRQTFSTAPQRGVRRARTKVDPKRSSLLRGLGRSIDYRGKGARRSSVDTPTPARVLRGCNVLLPKGALWTSFTASPQQVCPCPVTSGAQGRGQMEEFIPPLWAPASQLAPNALMPTQGPQSAQPFSSTSPQAAPFQLFLRRERREEKRWSWPSLRTSLVHL